MHEFAICLDIYSIFVVIQGVKLTKCRFKKEQIVSSIILETKISAKLFCQVPFLWAFSLLQTFNINSVPLIAKLKSMEKSFN